MRSGIGEKFLFESETVALSFSSICMHNIYKNKSHSSHSAKTLTREDLSETPIHLFLIQCQLLHPRTVLAEVPNILFLLFLQEGLERFLIHIINVCLPNPGFLLYAIFLREHDLICFFFLHFAVNFDGFFSIPFIDFPFGDIVEISFLFPEEI